MAQSRYRLSGEGNQTMDYYTATCLEQANWLFFSADEIIYKDIYLQNPLARILYHITDLKDSYILH